MMITLCSGERGPNRTDVPTIAAIDSKLLMPEPSFFRCVSVSLASRSPTVTAFLFLSDLKSYSY